MSDSVVQPAITRTAEAAPRGQSMLEFAIILPILLALVGGIVQYGAMYVGQHSLIQIGRDLGRWAATQPYDVCNTAEIATPPQPLTEANRLALESGLAGYGDGDWNIGNFDVLPDNTSLPANPPHTQGIEVVWSYVAGDPCPPEDSTDEAFVTIRLTHRIPVVLPGFPYLPGFGTCDASGCHLVSTTTAEFRMEPPADG